MNLSQAQNHAIKCVMDWFTKKPFSENKSQVFKLFGYAGTGKTTIAKHIMSCVSGNVMFGAYTGKAASVMREKGCLGAETIHSLIYLVREKSKAFLLELEKDVLDKIEYKNTLKSKDAIERVEQDITDLNTLIKEEREKLSSPSFTVNPDSPVKDASLLILDECSMIDGDIAKDLLSFNVPVLVLGDPGQLPPIYGQGFFTSNPDILLTEVHRQAENDPIIKLATQVRNLEHLKVGSYGQSHVLPAGTKLEEKLLDYDQILVGKNITRRQVNHRIRNLRGYTSWHPMHGEKLICLRNNKDLGLLNGTMWVVEDIGEIDHYRLVLTLRGESNNLVTVEMHGAPFRGEEVPYYEKKEAQEFDFGYGITVHKSQGSQWDKILIIDESYCFGENRFKWLYTGVTRAAHEVTVLKIPQPEWRR